MAKKLIFSVVSAVLFSAAVTSHADVSVVTNPDNVGDNGIYDGRISRVIFYSADEVRVFLESGTDSGIGVMFSKDHKFIGAAVADSIGKNANISKQEDGSYTFAVNE